MTRRRYINKPFDRLPLKRRAIFILYISGFTYREIKSLLGTGSDFVSSTISSSWKEYYKNLGSKPSIYEGEDEKQ